MANVMYLRGMEASDQQKVDLISEISNLIDKKKTWYQFKWERKWIDRKLTREASGLLLKELCTKRIQWGKLIFFSEYSSVK